MIIYKDNGISVIETSSGAQIFEPVTSGISGDGMVTVKFYPSGRQVQEPTLYSSVFKADGTTPIGTDLATARAYLLANTVFKSASGGSEALTPIKVLREGEYVYVRTSFSETQDLVQSLRVYYNDSFKNNNMNFWKSYLITKATVDTSAAYTAGTRISDQEDDMAPHRYNGTYIGANHGQENVMIRTVVGHGLSRVDIGRVFTDSYPVIWYLIDVVGNNLYFLREDKGIAPVWSFGAFFPGSSTMTPEAGTSNMTPIPYSAPTGFVQMLPAVSGQVKRMFLDNGVEVFTDGLYETTELFINESYRVVNPRKVIDLLRSLKGRTYTDAQLIEMYKSAGISSAYDIIHNFQNNGAYVANATFINYDQINLNLNTKDYLSFIQGFILRKGGTLTKFFQHIPKALPITVGARTYDFRNTENFTTAATGVIDLTTPYWEVPTSPPERTTMFLADASDVKKVGFAMGYDLVNGQGNDRDSLTNNAWQIATSQKSYPRAVNDLVTPVAANSTFNFVVYRTFFDPESTDRGLSNGIIHYKSIEDDIVILDYNQLAPSDTVVLPASLLGKTITVVEKSANVTIGSLSGRNLSIDVSGTPNAYIVLKFN
tara:strand:- start:4318 stop:6114 length:1797 start_codon:yes stop_codon:yes gene_type:complete